MMKFIKFIYSRQISQQFGMPLYISLFSPRTESVRKKQVV